MNPSEAVPDSILRHRAFLLYWGARTSASLGFMMFGVAVAWQMYALTGNAFDLGLVGLMQFLPMAMFMLIAGQIADRHDRRLMLQICQVVEALVAASLAIATLSGWISKELMLAAVFVFGLARAFEAPTQQTLLPSIVPAALFPRAVAASASTMQLATICGPALGRLALHLRRTRALHGLLRLLHRLGGAAGVPASRAAARQPDAHQPRGIFRRHFLHPAQLRSSSASSRSICSRCCSAAPRRCCRSSPTRCFTPAPKGSVCCARRPAIGAVAVSATLVNWPLTRHIGRIMFFCVALFGIATIVFALSTSFLLSMAALAVLGASDAVSVVIRFTLVQIETPDDMRGRVNAVNSLFTGTSNQLGDFRAGAMAAWLGAIPAVLVGGAGILLVVLIWMRAFPSLVRVSSFYKDDPDRVGRYVASVAGSVVAGCASQ